MKLISLINSFKCKNVLFYSVTFNAVDRITLTRDICVKYHML